MGLDVNKRKDWIIAGVATVCLITGVALSHRVEPGVRVQKVTLAEDTPALEFIPAGLGPHPLALLAHGYAAWKETLFRYGEALAAAGFICYSVDQPGHGASPQKFTFMEAAHTLEAVARDVGPVDVFAGWSTGGYTGGEAVPALLKTRRGARLVISPWSDHVLEGFDPVLVNAAVEAACAAVHQTPPAPAAAWLWRPFGVILAMLGAGALASYLTDSLPRLARFRGLLIGGFVAGAFVLTIRGGWLDATPDLLSLGIAIPVAILLAIIVGRFRIPRWSFVALNLLVAVTAAFWFHASQSRPALILMAATLVLMPALIAGMVIAWFASRHRSRLQGDIAMAIFLGCLLQCWKPLRTAPPAPTPHTATKLDAKLLDACIGEYEIVPDNVFDTGAKVTVRRKGDHLVWQTFFDNAWQSALDLYPESETNFFFNKYGTQVTFIKDDKGDVMAISRHKPGLPDVQLQTNDRCRIWMLRFILVL